MGLDRHVKLRMHIMPLQVSTEITVLLEIYCFNVSMKNNLSGYGSSLTCEEYKYYIF